MKYYHEYKDGKHRLGTSKYSSETKEGPIRWGKWAGYTSPAMLGQYVAVTDYYTGSTEFPDCTKLYKIQRGVWPLIVIPETEGS